MHISNKFFYLSLLLTSVAISFAVSANASAADRIHFLKDEDKLSGDAIIIESNGRFGLVDAMNPKKAEGNTDDTFGAIHDNGEKVKQYLNKLCKNAGRSGNNCYLDFFIATHSHSDHIGGVPEIAGLINNRTIVFYKPPMGNQYYWENKESGNNRNLLFYDNMISVLQERRAVMCDTSALNCIPSQNSAITNVVHTFTAEKKITDSIEFTFGYFHISLFNLYHPYEITNNGNLYQGGENANSIVALISAANKEKTKIALMGDVYTTSMTGENSIQIEKILADKIGKVNVLKAAHHGHSDTSNAPGTLDIFDPQTYIITRDTARADTIDAVAHLKAKNTKIYYTSQSSGALVVKITKTGYEIKDSNAEALESGGVSPIGSKGWQGWQQIGESWCYFYTNSEGKLTTMRNSWKLYKNDWYYFGSAGIMMTNSWQLYKNDWYYLGSDGKMATNSWLEYQGAWYYLGNDGKMLKDSWHESEGKNGEIRHFYFGSDGKMATGSRKINGKTYHFGSDGACLDA